MGLLDRLFSTPGDVPFTERTRTVLTWAQEESATLGHEYVGTEHLLLALLRDEGGVAAGVFDRASVDRRRMRDTIDSVIKRGTVTAAMPNGRPLTSRTKSSLDLALREARALHHRYLGTEHLLLGLLAEEKGIAAQVLVDGGLTLDRARALTVEILGPPRDEPPNDSRVV